MKFEISVRILEFSFSLYYCFLIVLFSLIVLVVFVQEEHISVTWKQAFNISRSTSRGFLSA